MGLGLSDDHHDQAAQQAGEQSQYHADSRADRVIGFLMIGIIHVLGSRQTNPPSDRRPVFPETFRRFP